MRHGLLAGFLIGVAPLHLVFAFSLIHPALNSARWFWLYFAVWLVISLCITLQLLEQRAERTWHGHRFFHQYYTLPVGILVTVHLVLFVPWQPEFYALLRSLEPDAERRAVPNEKLEVQNALKQPPGRVFRGAGAFFRLILVRAVSVVLAIIRATPWWVWIFVLVIAPFFRR